MKALWGGKVLAESDSTIVVEGNHYFPPASVERRYLRDSTLRTTCSWKGEALYYDIVADRVELKDGAWYYPDPKNAAAQIKNYVAFWKGVIVEK